jgi:hypothetical protein
MEDELVRLEAVSELLRKTLKEARGPNSPRQALGVGPDGTVYEAALWHDGRVFMRVYDPTARIPVPIPEPEVLVWKPILPDRKGLKLEQVSEGLRKACTKHIGQMVGALQQV